MVAQLSPIPQSRVVGLTAALAAKGDAAAVAALEASLAGKQDTIAPGTYAKPATTGTLAERPAASVIGQRYRATDVNGGTVYESIDGATWSQMAAGVAEVPANVVIDPVQHLTRTRSPRQATRYAGNPIFTTAMAGVDFATIYWPWVLRVDNILQTPLGRYYMWFSTDHGASNGRIGMAWANNRYGPWTSVGTVYLDRVIGDETETPAVIWNEGTGLFHMYYQQNATKPTSIANQSTCLATSPDGVAWTRVGVVLDWPGANEFRGISHTGYFRPLRLGNMWYGFHLMGGGDQPTYGMSYSSDGIEWEIDPRLLSYYQDLVGSHNLQVAPNKHQVVMYRGQPWVFTVIRDFTSGVVVATSKLVAAPLSPDLRQIIGVPRTIIDGAAGEAWVTSTDVVRNMYVLVEDGEVVVYYGPASVFGVATVVMA